jgi:ubiquinone/menaquinone biosynthesis C-methylase UbiE
MALSGQEAFAPFACPACHGVAFNGSECAGCGHPVAVHGGIPVLVKDFAQLSEQLDEAAKSDKAEWYKDDHAGAWQGPYRHHLKKRVDLVTNYLRSVIAEYKTPPALLDMGCGDGGNFFWLSTLGADLYASDYNLLRLQRADGRGMAKRIALADILNYPAPDNQFDIVFFNHVLEHIVEDERALAETFRILKPGGTCVLGVPNEGSFWWQMAYKFEPQSMKTTDHVQFYTAKALSAKARKAGFDIDQTHHIGWGLPHWSLDNRVRGYKFLDDLFEKIGRVLIPTQASSLYLFLRKPG